MTMELIGGLVELGGLCNVIVCIRRTLAVEHEAYERSRELVVILVITNLDLENWLLVNLDLVNFKSKH